MKEESWAWEEGRRGKEFFQFVLISYHLTLFLIGSLLVSFIGKFI